MLSLNSTLNCDNQGPLQIVVNPVFHEHTKYIVLLPYCLRKIFGMVFYALYIPPPNLGVFFNFYKTIGKVTFHALISKLGTSNLHTPPSDGVLKLASVQEKDYFCIKLLFQIVRNNIIVIVV